MDGTANQMVQSDESASRTHTASPRTTDAAETHELVFDFNTIVDEQTVNPEASSNRKLAFMCGRLEFFNDRIESVARYDIGTPDNEPTFVTGVYHPEQGSFENRTFRWFGGPAARTVIRIDPFDASDTQPTTALVRGTPVVDNEIEADVSFDGTQTAHIAFGERGGWQTYQFQLE